MRSLTGKAIEATYLESQPGDVKHSLADVDAARRELGYEPKVDVMEGLRRTLAWYTEARAEHREAA